MTISTPPSKKADVLRKKRAKVIAQRPNFAGVDLNQDGRIDPDELNASNQLLELELREEKADTQRRMAWTAMIGMLMFTGLLFTPMFSNDRIASLADVLDVFYIAQAGIVGAYMGITAWMARKNDSSYGGGGSGGGY